jgi:phage gp36-like protein
VSPYLSIEEEIVGHPYCAKADILGEISEEELIGLTDDEQTGLVNDSRVTEAITRADDLIDSYCGQVAEVPFATIPGVIKQHSKTMVIYFLFARRSAVPENRRKDYDDALAHLKAIAKGDASLPPITAADVTGGNEVSISSEERIFTRDKMKGF